MQIIRNWRKARVRAVGIATRYRVNGPGIESQCGQSFPQQSKTALAPNPASLYIGCRVFLGDKVAEAWHLSPTLI
jgi:hypothetical protein